MMWYVYMMNLFVMTGVLIWLIFKKALWVAILIQALYTMAFVVKSISLCSFYHPKNEVKPVSVSQISSTALST